MTREQVAEIVRNASALALEHYLRMCGLDSPWEVPEAFLAAESAKALSEEGLRVAIEFKLDRASNHPSVKDINEAPARLQKAYAHLDVAILKPDSDDPWQLTVDGIIEFKKHNSMKDDANLIEFMLKSKNITYAVLALLVVGRTAQFVTDEEKRLTSEFTAWQKLPEARPPQRYPPLPNSNVGDRWWTICCLIPT